MSSIVRDTFLAILQKRPAARLDVSAGNGLARPTETASARGKGDHVPFVRLQLLKKRVVVRAAARVASNRGLTHPHTANSDKAVQRASDRRVRSCLPRRFGRRNGDPPLNLGIADEGGQEALGALCHHGIAAPDEDPLA